MADDLDFRVVQTRLHDLGADGADAVVNGTYLLLLHVCLHVPGCPAQVIEHSEAVIHVAIIGKRTGDG